ncbi:MAG: ATP synthase F1 subunit epsilon [Roseburia sp.]
MADESRIFQVEIITPDRIFHRGEATMIEFNTAAGEIGVYKKHIPLTTVLAPGVVRIHRDGEEDLIAAVHSGFAEILPDKVTLLAETAEWPEEIDKARAEAAKQRAEERLAHKTEAIDVKRAEFALRKALVRIDIAK